MLNVRARDTLVCTRAQLVMPRLCGLATAQKGERRGATDLLLR
jgi:hypothetical protein